MNRWVLRTLNLFSSLFSSMLYFPIIVMAVQLTYMTMANWAPDAPRVTVKESLLCYAVIIGVSLLGRWITLLLDDVLHLKPMPRRITTIFLSFGAAYLTWLAATLIVNGFASYVVAIIGLAAFISGSSVYFLTYHQVLTLRNFAVASAVHMLVLLFLYSNECSPFGAGVYAANLLVGLLMMVLAMNQGGIDTMMHMRRHRLDQLPPKIRIYNLKLTVMITGLMMLTAVFYKPLEILVRFTGIMLRKGFAGMLVLLFTDYTSGDVVSYDYSVPWEEDDELDESSYNLFDNSAEPHIAWEILLYIVLIGAALIVIINMPKILRALRTLFRTFFKWLSEMLHADRRREKIFADEEYVDIDETVESLPDEEIHQQKELRPSAKWRSWRSQYRRYNSMEAGEARMRSGYQLVLQWLDIQEVPVETSDTTLDIVRTTDLTLDFSDLNPATQQYNLVRYGGMDYNLCQPNELDALLSQMAQNRTAPKLSRLARARKEEELREGTRK